MPAIATEGRALFDAVVAQGIAGMLARQRKGPTCRASEAGCGASSRPPPGVPPRDRGPSGDDGEPAAPTAAAPVLAMLSRLPLDDER